MFITHHLNDMVVREKSKVMPSFLMTNKRGSSVFFGANGNNSRFQGCFFTDKSGEVYKAIEAIKLAGTETQELRNNFYNFERIGNNCLERYFMNHTNSLLLEILNYSGYVDLTLDCRKIYDYDDKGRVYSVEKNNDCLLIVYKKYKDESQSEEDYKIYIAIAGAKEYLETGDWELNFYESDYKRGSSPSELYVYKAARIKVDGNSRLVFSYSNDKDEALSAAKHAMDNFEFLGRAQEHYVLTLTKAELRTQDLKIIMAYKCSLAAMDSFFMNAPQMKGILAGFLWFTQVWTRDEAIALKSLMIEERFSDVKQVLFRQMGKILPDGRIPNRFPGSLLGSADGVGWVFARIFDFIRILKARGRFDEFLSLEELMYIKKRLRLSIQRLIKWHTKDGFVTNEALETWMDTGYADDTREGVRIELQALQLNMYKLMTYLCRLTENEPRYFTYSKLEYVTHKSVKLSLWKNGILQDGLSDPTIRPNIFMAYYIYPELLTRRQWTRCFDNALKHLFLDWGGIASIDTEHKYFVPEYSGENNRSYHRGDSWFFLNNMAALCLYRLDRKRYKKQIEKIVAASTDEILFKGVIGFHSELSSAKELRSEGNRAQAWSSAMYIELIREMY